MIIRYLIFLLLCSFSDSIHAREHPYKELENFLKGKVWISNKSCLNDTCYSRADSSYYYASKISDFIMVDTMTHSFVLNNAFYAEPLPRDDLHLVFPSCRPYIFLLKKQKGKPIYHVRAIGEGLDENYELRIINDSTFQFTGKNWLGKNYLEEFISITLPEEIYKKLFR